MREEIRKHFCQEDNDYIDYFRNSSNEFLDQQSMIVDFTSKPEELSEEAGLSFKQNTPSHLRGLKDYEIDFLLNFRNKNHRC